MRAIEEDMWSVVPLPYDSEVLVKTKNLNICNKQSLSTAVGQKRCNRNSDTHVARCGRPPSSAKDDRTIHAAAKLDFINVRILRISQIESWARHVHAWRRHQGIVSCFNRPPIERRADIVEESSRIPVAYMRQMLGRDVYLGVLL